MTNQGSTSMLLNFKFVRIPAKYNSTQKKREKTCTKKSTTKVSAILLSVEIHSKELNNAWDTKVKSLLKALLLKLKFRPLSNGRF